jgi:hypothetical protein
MRSDRLATAPGRQTHKPSFDNPVAGPRRQDRHRTDTKGHGGAIVLVLARKIGERIVVDDKISITVVEIRGRQIRLSIEAPKGQRRDQPLRNLTRRLVSVATKLGPGAQSCATPADGVVPKLFSTLRIPLHLK